MDEPFAALDPRTRATLQQWLRTIRERHGLTVVLVTHDLDEALALADRVLLFSTRPGRIVGSWTVPQGAHDTAVRTRLRAEILDQYQTDIGVASIPRHQYATAAASATA
jgi:ABC-type nitrate/sulfonate/bicarbonate transport system ATPase subunit